MLRPSPKLCRGLGVNSHADVFRDSIVFLCWNIKGIIKERLTRAGVFELSPAYESFRSACIGRAVYRTARTIRCEDGGITPSCSMIDLFARDAGGALSVASCGSKGKSVA